MRLTPFRNQWPGPNLTAQHAWVCAAGNGSASLYLIKN